MSELRKGLILMIASSNEDVDNLARGAIRTYRDLVQRGKAPPDQGVLRLYSPGAETSIKLRDVRKTMERNPNARPDVEAVDVHSLSAIDALVRFFFAKGREHKYEGVYDSRVQYIELSLRMAFAKRIGLIEDPEATNPDDKKVHEAFRKDFIDYYSSKDMDQSQRDAYIKKEKAMMTAILQEASVIVGTTYMAGSAIIAKALADSLTGIILDEASHQRDDSLLHLFALRLNEYKFLMMIGDIKQLSPPMIIGPKDSVFAKEFHLAMRGRLQLLGFPRRDLLTQSRCVPEIIAIAIKISYGNKVTCTRKTWLGLRENRRLFRKWAQNRWKLKTPSQVIFLDRPKSDINRVDVSHGKSSFNRLMAIMNLDMVVDILKQFADMPGEAPWRQSPHMAQAKLYEGTKASMRLDQKFAQSVDNLGSMGNPRDRCGQKEYTFPVCCRRCCRRVVMVKVWIMMQEVIDRDANWVFKPIYIISYARGRRFSEVSPALQRFQNTPRYFCHPISSFSSFQQLHLHPSISLFSVWLTVTQDAVLGYVTLMTIFSLTPYRRFPIGMACRVLEYKSN